MTEDTGRQRIDKWMWFARIVKTRALAQDLASSGRVRVNGRKIDAPAQPVRPGDVLTVGIGERVRVLKVTGFAARRGSSPQALELYEDLSPARPLTAADTAQDTAPTPAAVDQAPTPVRGDGRPTKRDRRRLDREIAERGGS